jgi:hypothetical protein
MFEKISLDFQCFNDYINNPKHFFVKVFEIYSKLPILFWPPDLLCGGVILSSYKRNRFKKCHQDIFAKICMKVKILF